MKPWDRPDPIRGVTVSFEISLQRIRPLCGFKGTINDSYSSKKATRTKNNRTSRNFGRPSFIPPPNNKFDIGRAPPLRTNRWWLLKSPSIIHRSPVLCHAYIRSLINRGRIRNGEEEGGDVYCAPQKSLY